VHDLYKAGDRDAPDEIKDRNGEVVLGLCKRCGRAEIELSEPCISEPRFFIDHGVIHDRVTGKHVVTDGEWPFEDTVEMVCVLLNSLTAPPQEASDPAELDADLARTAAEQANSLFGQWMPERWLNLFIDSYNDIAACRAASSLSRPHHQGGE
jgi:hypothetical protein